MQRKTKPLTVTIYVGGKQVDGLTAEQSERMAQRLSETMSVFYTSHASEYEKISKE